MDVGMGLGSGMGRLSALGQGSEPMPVVQSLQKKEQFIQAGRFNDVAVGAQIISTLDIQLPGRSAKDMDCQPAATIVLANPFQDFETVGPRQVQVQQE